MNQSTPSPTDSAAKVSASQTYPHNPSHAIGTCAKCGGEMTYNVPRIGPAGGFIHKASQNVDCK